MLAAPEIHNKRSLCQNFETLPKDVRFPPMFTIVEIDAILSQLVVEEVQVHRGHPEPETAIEIDDDEEKTSPLSIRRNKRY